MVGAGRGLARERGLLGDEELAKRTKLGSPGDAANQEWGVLEASEGSVSERGRGTGPHAAVRSIRDLTDQRHSFTSPWGARQWAGVWVGHRSGHLALPGHGQPSEEELRSWARATENGALSHSVWMRKPRPLPVTMGDLAGRGHCSRQDH